MSSNGVAATSVRFRTTEEGQDTDIAEEEAAQLYERRAAELKRLDLCGRRPFPKVGRPNLQSLYENALFLQVRTDLDSTKHITDKTVPHGWKRGMSVVADVQDGSFEVFVVFTHTVGCSRPPSAVNDLSVTK